MQCLKREEKKTLSSFWCVAALTIKSAREKAIVVHFGLASSSVYLFSIIPYYQLSILNIGITRLQGCLAPDMKKPPSCQCLCCFCNYHYCWTVNYCAKRLKPNQSKTPYTVVHLLTVATPLVVHPNWTIGQLAHIESGGSEIGLKKAVVLRSSVHLFSNDAAAAVDVYDYDDEDDDYYLLRTLQVKWDALKHLLQWHLKAAEAVGRSTWANSSSSSSSYL